MPGRRFLEGMRRCVWSKPYFYIERFIAKLQGMALIISDKLLESIDLTAPDLLVEIACFLYASKRLGFGKAKQLSGLNFVEFQHELGKRKIDRHYDEDDLAEDLRTLNLKL